MALEASAAREREFMNMQERLLLSAFYDVGLEVMRGAASRTTVAPAQSWLNMQHQQRRAQGGYGGGGR